MDICQAHINDTNQLLALYKTISDIPDGIIRNKGEIDNAYIQGFLSRALKNGLILVGKIENRLVGEIHAYTPDIFAFKHLLTDLTIVVDPKFQGKGIGSALFKEFLDRVKHYYPHILRVELFVREHNTKNVSFYKKLGFIDEGRQESKIICSDLTLQTPLHMVWFNPNFNIQTHSV